MVLSRIEDAVSVIGLVVAVDDEVQENEADLITAAEKITPELIAVGRYSLNILEWGPAGTRSDYREPAAGEAEFLA